MRALTSAEVRELEDGCCDKIVDNGTICMDAIANLSKRGLIKYSCDGRYHDTRTTKRGRLALRIHKAYLASL